MAALHNPSSGAEGFPSGSGPTARRQSQSNSRTLAAVDVPKSPVAPSRVAAAVVKHGKYVAAGAAGVWWLDLPAAINHIMDGPQGWTRRILVVALACHALTVIQFLYLVLFLPWFRGYIPNYPKWQQSRRLRIIVPVLTVSILLGWACLVFALTRTRYAVPGGPVREAVRAALKLDADVQRGMRVWTAMAGATAVYTLTFGLLGFIPAPNVPVRAVSSTKKD